MTAIGRTNHPTATPHAAPPLMLSVSGARGIVGRTMTPQLAVRLTAAFGSHVRATCGQPTPVICLGRDSRPSGAMLADAADAGLASVGCAVRRLGIVATPTVGVMIGHHRAAGGVCITASHNPIEWNGLKLLNERGVASPAAESERILARFHAGQFEMVDAASVPATMVDDSATDVHLQRVLALIDEDVEAIKRLKLRVVLDSINGAGCVGGRALLEALGCDVVHLNGEPNGRFAHTPEPTEANLVELARAVANDTDAAIGFAQDPDADRLAIVDENGRYIGEEYTLALCASRMFELRGAGHVAANLSTSRMIDDIAAGFPGSTVHRSAVGEANVVDAMLAHGAILGGEGNGGVIIPDVCYVRDSLGSIVLVLSLLADRMGRDASSTIGSIVDALPRYAMVKHKYDLTNIGGRDALPEMFDRLCESMVAMDASARIDDSDGVRIDVVSGWVHLRPSNTEPIVRLIAEARDTQSVASLVKAAAHACGRAPR